ncbi:hypothetical protein CCP3SC5AM1_30048 [Gammaproteobacteria bacterium]
MSIDDKVLRVMKGLNQAITSRGWCLVEGEVGVGKTRAIQEAVRQIGWQAAWMGVSDLESEETRQTLAIIPKELLVLDGLVDEWAPSNEMGLTPAPSWTALYMAITLAMSRASHNLMTVICVAIHREGKARPPEWDYLPGCVVITLD